MDSNDDKVSIEALALPKPAVKLAQRMAQVASDNRSAHLVTVRVTIVQNEDGCHWFLVHPNGKSERLGKG